MDNPLTFRLVAHGSLDYEATIALRDDILRRPLGLTFDPAHLAAEAGDYHLACYRDAELVGCLVLTPRDNGDMKMRQVAVAEAEQGRGIGRALVIESERVARDLGYSRMVLNARAAVVPFYEKLGYETYGEPFEEVTIPHRSMRKRL
jgi:predicted GNAT family N-acyltransferase